MSIQNNFVENSTSSFINKLDELIINWHISEACNYSCTYCFVKWGKPNKWHRSLEARNLPNEPIVFLNEGVQL